MAEVSTDKYKSNSYKAKAEAEKEARKPVIDGGARKHKKTSWDKFKEAVFGERVDNLWDFLIFEYVIPTSKELLSESIDITKDMILFGEVRSRKGERKTGRGRYVPYDEISRRPSRSRDIDRTRRSSIDFSELEFDTRPKAEKVLRSCQMEIEEEGFIPVAGMYAYAGLYSEDEDYTPSPTDYNYGWTNLDMVEVYLRGDGMYVFRFLPRPKPLRQA